MAKSRAAKSENFDGLETPVEEVFTTSKELDVPEVQETPPANIKETPSVEPVKAPEAPAKEEIETDVRTRLSSKSVDENIFVPTNPAAVEKKAASIAEEQGFELTRGTSIGARLMARRHFNRP
jgi:hypothetical protein